MPPGPPRPLPQLEQIVSPTWHQPAARRPPASLTPLFLLATQNAEIFTLTYGSIVRQLIADFEDLDEVNKQLDKM